MNRIRQPFSTRFLVRCFSLSLLVWHERPCRSLTFRERFFGSSKFATFHRVPRVVFFYFCHVLGRFLSLRSLSGVLSGPESGFSRGSSIGVI